MRVLGLFAIVGFLSGCVSGAPILNHEQELKLSEMKVFMSDESPSNDYEVISELASADCSGPGGSRLYGDEGKAIDILKAKAAYVNAEAVVDVSCGSAPFVNNCWAAKKCNGKAVTFK